MNEISNGVFYQGDCLDIMKDIPDGMVDMVLCDLPYGTTNAPWDNIIPFEQLWEQYWRITKPNAAIVLFGSQPFTSKLIVSDIDNFRYEWIWSKNKGSGHLNAGRMPMKYHENICVFYKKLPTYNAVETDGHKPMNYAKNNNKSSLYNEYQPTVNNAGTTKRKPRSIINFPVVNNDGSGDGRIHPTQKPIELLSYLIQTYTNPSEIVLDNCAGSGSVAIAAERINRSWICIEQDEDFYKKAVQRVKNEVGKCP